MTFRTGNDIGKLCRKLMCLALCAAMIIGLAACGEKKEAEPAEDSPKTYKVGICNYVDDASLNQIADNIRAGLAEEEQRLGVSFEIRYENCNADSAVLAQIISDFTSEGVDLMIGIATPVAMAMQSATEDSGIPVIFSAVSDPLACGLVESLEQPGANITGTSDYLNTNALLELIFAVDPEADKIGLLYDIGQDSSAGPIAEAKRILAERGVETVDYTAGNNQEAILAVQSLLSSDVDAVFTPTDNTMMTAELSIYEMLSEAGIPHYAGADSFALNGAFIGFGVDYAELGKQTAYMVSAVLCEGADPASTPVMTFDNGKVTINTDICEDLGYDYDDVAKAFEGLCTKTEPIRTAESF